MLVNSSIAALLAVASLFCSGLSLPFHSSRANVLAPFERRAAYSVVPVDGGEPPATVVQTLVQTQAPVTVIKTYKLTPQPLTNIVVTTKVVEGPKATQTIQVTVTKGDATTPEYSIINVSPPPLTVVISVPVAATPFLKPASTSSSTEKPTDVPSVPVSATPTSDISPATSTSSASSLKAPPAYSASIRPGILPSALLPALKPLSSTVPSATLLSSTSTTSSYSNASSTPHASIEPATSSSSRSSPSCLPISDSETTTSTASTSTTITTATFDNGKWHTNYPSWRNVTRKALGTLPILTPKRLDLAHQKSAEVGHSLFKSWKRFFI